MSTTFQTQLVLGSNVPQVIQDAVDAVDKLPVAHQKAQARITAIIARGDPLKEAQAQAAKDLKLVQDLEKKKEISAKDGEEARTAIAARYAKDRQRIEEQAAQAIVTNSGRATASAVPLQAAMKGLKEPLANVVTGATAMGNAFGGAHSMAGQAATGIVGAFGAGGPIAVAIAGTTALLAVGISKWSAMQKSIEDARDAALQAQAALKSEIGDQVSDLEKQNKALQAKIAGKDPELEAMKERAAVAGQLADVADIDVATATKRREEAERLLEVLRQAQQIRETGGTQLQGAMSRVFSPEEQAVLREARGLDQITIEQRAESSRGKEAEASGRGEELRRIQRLTEEQERLKQRLKDVEEMKRQQEKQATAGVGDAKKAAAAAQKDEEDWASGSTSSRAELDLLGGAFGESPKQHADRVERDREKEDKLWDKAFGDTRVTKNEDGSLAMSGGTLSGIDAHLLKTQEAKGNLDNEQARLAQEAADTWGNAGLDAGTAFFDSFEKLSKSKKPGDIFGSILDVASPFLELFGLGGVAKLGKGFAKLFRGGGGWEDGVPRGRGGLSMGNVDDEGPYFMHRKEVLFRESVVDQAPGGYQQMARIARGDEPLGNVGRGRGGGTVIIQQQSFAPQEARFAYAHHLDQEVRHLSADRADGLTRQQMQQSLLPLSSV